MACLNPLRSLSPDFFYGCDLAGDNMRRIGLKNCSYCGSSKVYISTPKTLWEKVPALAPICEMPRLHTPSFPAAPCASGQTSRRVHGACETS
jgi:hypothetical protein